MLLTLIHLLGAGWIILLGAIGVNTLAARLQLPTWYDVLSHDSSPIEALLGLAWYQLLFLVVVYPLLLGLLAYLAVIIFRR